MIYCPRPDKYLLLIFLIASAFPIPRRSPFGISVCNSTLSIVFSHNFNLSILSAKASLANIRKDIVNIIDL